MRFVHDNLPQRVRFGSGEAAASLEREIGDIGASRVMVIASKGEAGLAGRITNGLPVALRHDDVVMHVPVEVAERAREAAVKARADAVVSVGGGSTTGLAKAVALTSGLPVIAVPTTYAGSEATAVWGLTEGARKTTGTDPRVLPKVIVYDAALTTSLPVEMSVASGLNALAHCVDAMWAPNADPINAAFAAEGIRSLRTGLPKVVARPEDIDGREHALYAAYLSAAAFASAGSGLHHKICHVLGGAYNLPHAQTHAVVLPYVLAFNAPRAAEAEQRIAAAFGTERAIDGLRALRAELGAPRALRDYGFAEADIPAAAEAILPAVPPSNPRPVTAEDLRRLLHAAWAGADPELSRTDRACSLWIPVVRPGQVHGQRDGASPVVVQVDDAVGAHRDQRGRGRRDSGNVTKAGRIGAGCLVGPAQHHPAAGRAAYGEVHRRRGDPARG
jgi:maleylacetate reductase